MSKKITVKLRPENIENISVRPCRKGVYLTFDAGNIRSIVCKYSKVITICTSKPIYDDERIPPILGPMLYSLLEKIEYLRGCSIGTAAIRSLEWVIVL